MSYIAKIFTRWTGGSHEFEIEELPTYSDFIDMCNDEIWNSIVLECHLYDAETDMEMTEFIEE